MNITLRSTGLSPCEALSQSEEAKTHDRCALARGSQGNRIRTYRGSAPGFYNDHHDRPARGPQRVACSRAFRTGRSEEHTSELPSLMRISYAVFCLKKKKTYNQQ